MSHEVRVSEALKEAGRYAEEYIQRRKGNGPYSGGMSGWRRFFLNGWGSDAVEFFVVSAVLVAGIVGWVTSDSFLAAVCTMTVPTVVGGLWIADYRPGRIIRWMIKRWDTPHSSSVMTDLLEDCDRRITSLKGFKVQRATLKMLRRQVADARQISVAEMSAYATIRALILHVEGDASTWWLEQVVVEGFVPQGIQDDPVHAAMFAECVEEVRAHRREVASLLVALDDVVAAEEDAEKVRTQERLAQERLALVEAQRKVLDKRQSSKVDLKPSSLVRQLAEDRQGEVSAQAEASQQLRESSLEA